MDSLLGICGLTESQCGESMFSKVTNLFGVANDPASKDVSVDNEDDQLDRSSDQRHATDDRKAMGASSHEEILSPSSPKQIPTIINEGPTSPRSPNNSESPDILVEKKGHREVETEKSKMSKRKRILWTAKGEGGGSPKVTGSVSPFGSEKSAEHDDQVDDVDALLASLEIPDFDISLDLEDKKDEEVPVKQTLWEVVNWKERIGREEVFSKLYRPTRSEVEELGALAKTLGIARQSGFFRSIGITSKETQNIQQLLSGDHSILLSVLHVACDGTKFDLLLFTDGFILKNQSVNYFNPLEKRYETCQLWKDVNYVEQVNHFEILIKIVDSSRKYELSSADEHSTLETIYQCLERVIIFHEMFDSTSDRTGTLGWQYLRVRKPAFTAAVTNDPSVLDGKHQIVSRSINELDAYNKHAPLHYAVLQAECSLDVIRALLNAGATPNLEDGDGKSAMYYGTFQTDKTELIQYRLTLYLDFVAERHELSIEIIEALASAGGKKSRLAETELRGELFSRVEGSNFKSEQRRERERTAKENEQTMKDQKTADAQEKTEAAQSEMSKAMTALIERGQKIELLDQKTKDLEAEARTFGDLAARLKNEVVGKKWYQL